MIESNRRRILAASSAAVLSALLLMNIVIGLSVGTKPLPAGMIALLGFAALLHVGAMAGAVFGITHLVRHKADRLGLFGAALTILGAAVAARIGVLIQLKHLDDATPAVTLEALSPLLQSAPIVWVSIIPVGLTYPIGLITLATALFIARPVSRWIAVALGVGGVLFPVGRAIGVIPAVYASDVLMALAFSALAWQILTRRASWDDAPVAASPSVRLTASVAAAD